MIEAIPTKYRSRQYRSRLEARWAAFFDGCGWDYEYEPFDLNGWIPDFVVMGKTCGGRYWPNDNSEPSEYDHRDKTFLVEVKPAVDQSQFPIAKIATALEQSDYYGAEILLLGAILRHYENWELGRLLGWWGTTYPVSMEDNNADRWNYRVCGSVVVTNYSDILGFSPTDFLPYCRITGYACGSSLILADAFRVEALWAEAGNAVQWRSPEYKL